VSKLWILKPGVENAQMAATALPAAAFDAAAAVLVFDFLIGNDDRHVEKANCLVRGDRVVLIDHERALPVLRQELRPHAWQPGGLDNVHRHVFFAALKGQMPDFASIIAALTALPAKRIDDYLAELPPGWIDSGAVARLRSFWLEMRDACPKFRDLLQETVR
jgi:hypothetical protein